jgi:RNA polymerase sigma-70 factor (ECF subfamily)
MEPSPSVAERARAVEPDPAQWFADEVHPHESQLRSYLRGRFPAVRDVDDVVQESYLRIWRARAARPIESAKAFLFTVARHLALDVVRRNRTLPNLSLGDLPALNVVEDKLHAADLLSYHEKVHLLADVLAALPDRCREIVVLRKLKCLSQREVATQLGLSERTVENQLARGIKRCEASFRRRGVHSLFS